MIAMRVLEWIFLLSCLPVLLLPHLSLVRGRRWFSVSLALLPLLVGLLHIVLEGWRTQMIPLYALAALIVVRRMIGLRGKGSPRRSPNVFLTGGLVVAIVVSGLLPGWLLPVFALPEPSGPYPVGIVHRELVDRARGRRLMASIWYPAARSGPRAALTDSPDALAFGLASAYGLPEAAPVLQHLRYIKVAASQSVPPANDKTPFPVLVFSHGLVGTRIQNSATFQELASWGYVVAALDHTDAAAVTVFPDGEIRPFDLGRLGIRPNAVETATQVLLPIWVADQRAVYDALDAWAKDDPVFGGKLDLQRVGSFGHSFGGVTALEVCRVDDRCRAAVNLDGGFASSESVKAAIRPILLMTSTASKEIAKANQGWSRLMKQATGPAYWLELPGSDHYSFTILPLLSPALAPTGFDAYRGLRTVDTYLRAFFDLYLRGIPTPLLESASGKTDAPWPAN
jgi:dienelactone hydrolase